MKLKTLFMSDEGKHAISFNMSKQFLHYTAPPHPDTYIFVLCLVSDCFEVCFLHLLRFPFSRHFWKVDRGGDTSLLNQSSQAFIRFIFCHFATLGFRKIHISMSYTSYTKFLLPQLPQFSLFITILTNLRFLENNKMKFAVGNSSTNKFYWTA